MLIGMSAQHCCRVDTTKLAHTLVRRVARSNTENRMENALRPLIERRWTIDRHRRRARRMGCGSYELVSDRRRQSDGGRCDLKIRPFFDRGGKKPDRHHAARSLARLDLCRVAVAFLSRLFGLFTMFRKMGVARGRCLGSEELGTCRQTKCPAKIKTKKRQHKDRHCSVKFLPRQHHFQNRLPFEPSQPNIGTTDRRCRDIHHKRVETLDATAAFRPNVMVKIHS